VKTTYSADPNINKAFKIKFLPIENKLPAGSDHQKIYRMTTDRKGQSQFTSGTWGSMASHNLKGK
jgi:hypothetical protein